MFEFSVRLPHMKYDYYRAKVGRKIKALYS